MKHPISKEYFPFSLFKPPIRSGKLLGRIGAMMRPPRSFFKDPAISAEKAHIQSYDGAEIEILIATPIGLDRSAPCLVYYHGGGFIFGGSWHHYDMARAYAKGAPCKLIFPQYRLAPKHPHPIPSEDCYAALRRVFENADALGIDAQRIAVGGDSAGGALAAAVCQMARDRGTALPCAQLLIYPVTDRRMETESNRIFTNTPMWNSNLSKRMWRAYVQDDQTNISYASPMEAASLAGLPPAYVETAEFDCLRDEGLAYAHALQKAEVRTEIFETKGTIHGFDIAKKATATKEAAEARLRFLQGAFYGERL